MMEKKMEAIVWDVVVILKDNRRYCLGLRVPDIVRPPVAVSPQPLHALRGWEVLTAMGLTILTV